MVIFRLLKTAISRLLGSASRIKTVKLRHCAIFRADQSRQRFNAFFARPLENCSPYPICPVLSVCLSVCLSACLPVCL